MGVLNRWCPIQHESAPHGWCSLTVPVARPLAMWSMRTDRVFFEFDFVFRFIYRNQIPRGTPGDSAVPSCFFDYVVFSGRRCCI